PDNITVSLTVTVTVDYDTSTTFKYYIDSVDDFDGNDWSSRYAADPRSEDLLEIPAKSLYYMENGMLRRLDGSGNVGDHGEMTSLIYTGRTFRNFQLDVDFRQGGNTWGQAMVAFGIEDPNTYVTLNGGGAAAYLTMEGSARFRGQLVRDTNSNGEVVANSNFADYAGTWSTKMHHMTLKVTKLKAILEIDGVEVHECALQEGYTGGYIGFMSNKNMAMYDNLSITVLDYDGNVITLEEHDNLPDTFDPNDPLIGEEEDDGTAAEIIGIDYKNNLNNKYSGLLGNGESSSIGDDYANDVNGSTPATGDSFPLYNVVAITGLAALAVLVSLRLKKRVRNI
ncbi:MAG: family 16 glycoside hydrolase, partial [Acutalibacteraceae bacterium]